MSRKKNQSIAVFLFIPAITVLLVFCMFFLWWQTSLQPKASKLTDDRISFIIQTGESTASILERLEEAGIIRSSRVAKIYIRLNNWDSKIQAGSYQLSPADSLVEVLTALQQGYQKQASLIVPEGYRLEQVAGLLCRQGLLCDSGYDQVLSTLIQQLGEGYFFPDTYFIDDNTSLDQLIDKVRDNLNKKTSSLFDNKFKNNLSQSDVFILASLVEREASTDQERPILAGILLNRLQDSWPLQVDATVQYIVGCSNFGIAELECKNTDWWPKDLTKKDLAIESSYNTYISTGLPPKPICNPGLPSLEAVVQPQLTDYFYYLHDKEGNIHYARNLDEHNQNVGLYIK